MSDGAQSLVFRVRHFQLIGLRVRQVLGSSVFWTSLLGDAGDTHAKREEKIRKKAVARSKGEHATGSLSQGLASGLQDAGAGLWEGVSGVVARPLEAVTSGSDFSSAPVEAAGNLFSGIGVGLVGLGELHGAAPECDASPYEAAMKGLTQI